MPPEESKVVVIHLEPGKPIQVGETTVTIKRWRNGKAVVELVGPPSLVQRNLDETPPDGVSYG